MFLPHTETLLSLTQQFIVGWNGCLVWNQKAKRDWNRIRDEYIFFSPNSIHSLLSKAIRGNVKRAEVFVYFPSYYTNWYFSHARFHTRSLILLELFLHGGICIISCNYKTILAFSISIAVDTRWRLEVFYLSSAIVLLHCVKCLHQVKTSTQWNDHTKNKQTHPHTIPNVNFIQKHFTHSLCC